MSQNKNIVLIMGRPNTGKSSSLRNLPMESMVYLNTDLKEIPFQSRFAAEAEISNATDILEFIQEIETNPDITGAVLDTVTFLMMMYERQNVATAKDTQKAWGNYGNFYRDFIHAIKSGTKDYVILAHEDTVYNEATLTNETKVPIKGAVGKVGVEADFTTILGTKQMPVTKLKKHENPLLNITDEEEEDGVKYVFTTRVTKDHPGEKMRAPIGFWNREELYIDNDVNLVFDRLKSYYGAAQAA
jgi:hypothetical protein